MSAGHAGVRAAEGYVAAGGAGNLDLGLMVTASHNPIEFNGLKLVGRGARPLSPEHFAEIRRRTEAGDFGAWRFSLRASNTENLLRLNVEARGDRGLVEAKVADLSGVISKWGDPC